MSRAAGQSRHPVAVSTPPAISVRGLSKRFGSVAALDGVDLDVGPREGVALLGENGAGKSTLLRVLATAVIPDGGSVTIDGWDALAAPARARSSIGFLLPEERSWYWRLSGRHNLEFYAALYGLSRPHARQRAAELLRAVELEDAADRRFEQYSSGMRLRLSLARALLPAPAILLLDEPTRSIDPLGREHFHELMRRAAGAHGASLLIATHYLDEAATLASRCMFLASGCIVGCTDAWQDAADLEQQLRERTG